MSPAHFWFGPLAQKSCSNRFSGHRQAVRGSWPGWTSGRPLPSVPDGRLAATVFTLKGNPEHAVHPSGVGTVTLFWPVKAARTTLSQCWRNCWRVYPLSAADTTCIPAAAGHPEHAAHCLMLNSALMFFNKDILHFRGFREVCRGLWRIASSSSRSASLCLRRAISVTSPVHVQKTSADFCCLLRQL